MIGPRRYRTVVVPVPRSVVAPGAYSRGKTAGEGTRVVTRHTTRAAMQNGPREFLLRPGRPYEEAAGRSRWCPASVSRPSSGSSGGALSALSNAPSLHPMESIVREQQRQRLPVQKVAATDPDFVRAAATLGPRTHLSAILTHRTRSATANWTTKTRRRSRLSDALCAQRWDRLGEIFNGASSQRHHACALGEWSIRLRRGSRPTLVAVMGGTTAIRTLTRYQLVGRPARCPSNHAITRFQKST